jgi:hypothetical protein
MPSVGFETPIAASERTQTHALDRLATRMFFWIVYSFYLAIRSTQYLLDQHNKEQDSENKLAMFIITSEYTKYNFMFHTIYQVMRDMCFILDNSLPQ